MSTTLAERAKVVPIQLNSHVRVRVCARKHNENRAQVQQKHARWDARRPRRTRRFGGARREASADAPCSGVSAVAHVAAVAARGTCRVRSRPWRCKASSGRRRASLVRVTKSWSVGHTGGGPAADGQRRQQRARVEGGCGRGGGRGSLERSKRAPLRCAARRGQGVVAARSRGGRGAEDAAPPSPRRQTLSALSSASLTRSFTANEIEVAIGLLIRLSEMPYDSRSRAIVSQSIVCPT